MGRRNSHREGIEMSDRDTTGGEAEAPTADSYPNGEPKSVRDAYDKQQREAKK